MVIKPNVNCAREQRQKNNNNFTYVTTDTRAYINTLIAQLKPEECCTNLQMFPMNKRFNQLTVNVTFFNSNNKFYQTRRTPKEAKAIKILYTGFVAVESNLVRCVAHKSPLSCPIYRRWAQPN